MSFELKRSIFHCRKKIKISNLIRPSIRASQLSIYSSFGSIRLHGHGRAHKILATLLSLSSHIAVCSAFSSSISCLNRQLSLILTIMTMVLWDTRKSMHYRFGAALQFLFGQRTGAHPLEVTQEMNLSFTEQLAGSFISFWLIYDAVLCTINGNAPLEERVVPFYSYVYMYILTHSKCSRIRFSGLESIPMRIRKVPRKFTTYLNLKSQF